jgi:hypothetical protein
MLQKLSIYALALFGLFAIASGGGDVSAMSSGFGDFVVQLFGGIAEFLAGFFGGFGNDSPQ